MGVGKSTTAAALAAALGWAHRDSDVDIAARGGGTGKELAAHHGVAHLHRVEAAVLLDALRSPDPTVISAAGSVVENLACRQALRAAAVFVLEVPTEELMARMASSGHRRPMSREEIDEVAIRRAPLVAEVATASIDAAAPTDQVVEAILAQLAR
jgi:shikimate kinase